jgi:8-oxo-dGTP pyrophosphatase MutT (NUDIX family)
VVRDHPINGIEVLLVKRASASRGFADLWVFPGGKVDAADRALADLLVTEPWAHRHLADAIATWRELHEETGGDAASRYTPAALRSVLPDIVRWAHWRAPQGARLDFDTQFFLLTASLLSHEPRPDGHEITELRWISPVQAFDEYLDGSLPAAPPTGFNLIELATAAATARSSAELIRQESGRAICCIQPRIDRRQQPYFTTFPWDRDYAALGTEDSPRLEHVPERYRPLPSRLPAMAGFIEKL